MRDRFGVKPLYWLEEQGQILFSSEIKPLLAISQNWKINSKQVSDYFSFRYNFGAETFFNGINKLKPGQYLEINSNKQKLFVTYWQPTYFDRQISTEEIQHKFLNSISIRADSLTENMGLFLSGGIDSSAIAELSKSKLKVLSYSTQNSLDCIQAQQTAYRLGHSFIRLDHQENFENLKKAILVVEEPFGDSILYANYEMMKAMRTQSRVALSGEGADEVFGGYAHQQFANNIDIFKWSPKWSRNLMSQMIKNSPFKLIQKYSPYPIAFDENLVKKVSLAVRHSSDSKTMFRELAQVWNRQDLSNLLNHEFQMSEYDKLIWQNEESSFLDFLNFDLNNWLPNYGLSRIDKLSMNFGLEIRLPYLDHEFVELVLSYLKINTKNRSNKQLLRVILKGLVPDEFIERKNTHFSCLNQKRNQNFLMIL